MGQMIPAPARALLGSDAVAHVWTRNPDGSPQVSVVWVLAEGDHILFGTDRGSVKVRNLLHDPHIILSIEDDQRSDHGYQHHLVAHGTACVLPWPDADLHDRLARQYLGLLRHPLAIRDSGRSVTVRVDVDRITGEGPWVEKPEHLATSSA